MTNRNLAALVLLLFAPGFSTAAIYRCDTAGGVVFSQVPCAREGVQIKPTKSGPAPETSQTAGRVSASAGPADSSQSVAIEQFEHLATLTPEAIVHQVGKPAASYLHAGTDHWLYPNAIKMLDNKRHCPELLLRDGVNLQINWLPEDIMQKSVAIADGIASWKPPSKIIVKTFVVADAGVQGLSKSIVLRRLGEPDAKRVFNGREVWEYQKVRLARDNPKTVTIYLQFDGDTVVSSARN